MRLKNGKFLMAAGAALLLMAMVLFLHNRWNEARADLAAREVLWKLDGADPEPAGESTDMPAVSVDENVYIGILSIPRFDLRLPVMSAWSYPGLKIAPGRFLGSAAGKDLIIAGHNYEHHFGKLKNLEAGDAVIFTDLEKNIFTYEVMEVETLKPTAVEEMVSGGWDLTLFTCTNNGRARVTVRCMQTQERDSPYICCEESGKRL